MAVEAGKGSVRRVLLSAIVVSVVAGGVMGFGTARLAAPAGQPPQAREFWVFTVVLPFNDSRPGFPPHDAFSPDRISVNQGDTVTVHFFNTETDAEDHSFTMDAPYAMHHVVHFGENTTFTFLANVPGIFPYRCVYHQPTMTGWLAVYGG